MSTGEKTRADLAVAQPGSVPALEAGGRRFESAQPDQPPVNDVLTARFWAKITKHGPDECWPWIGASFKGGYGAFSVGGRRLVTATRYAYLLATGAWPGRFSVLHACDNPPCCNPAHLWLGLHSDNAKDMVTKGRHARAGAVGEKNGSARLTEANVAEIKRAVAWGETDVSIAARYGVSSSAIAMIRTGKFWKHVA